MATTPLRDLLIATDDVAWSQADSPSHAVGNWDVAAPRRRYLTDRERGDLGMPQKKWLRAPVFGPAEYVCYDCGEPRVVGWFAHAPHCSACLGERFTLPHRSHHANVG